LAAFLTLFLTQGFGRASADLVIVTWNVKWSRQDPAAWLRGRLTEFDADVLCLQEIAESSANRLQLQSLGFSQCAPKEYKAGDENAVFGRHGVSITPVAVSGLEYFTHPPAVVYLASRGLDTSIIVVHLKEGNDSKDRMKREEEMDQLVQLVVCRLRADPDVMIVGDFNVERPEAERLVDKLEAGTRTGGGSQEWILEPVDAPQGTTKGRHTYDYFLLSPDLAGEEAAGFSVGLPGNAMNWSASDHRPVIGRFRTDAQFQDRH
jgi:endonuclease/exonuclease/phosphatase family metal-dependent hydrolase